jgi:hypothetical protein
VDELASGFDGQAASSRSVAGWVVALIEREVGAARRPHVRLGGETVDDVAAIEDGIRAHLTEMALD